MKLLCKIIAVVIFAYASGFLLTVTFNPEVQFWTKAIQQRDQVIQKIHSEHPDEPIIYFTGGSSCAFSVDPKIIESETSLHSVNLGLPVASGREYILHQALRRCKSGDFLVLALEPDVLCYTESSHLPSRLGYALDANNSNPFSAILSSSGGTLKNTSGWLSTFRPGSRYIMTLTGRALSGKGYRYKNRDLRYNGRIETSIKLKQYEPSGAKTLIDLTTDGRAFLEKAASLAAKKNVRIAYSLPWRLTSTDALEQTRLANQKILFKISAFMPVLHDPVNGAVDEESIYSDSEWHLDAVGSRMRSEAIASGTVEWLQAAR